MNAGVIFSKNFPVILELLEDPQLRTKGKFSHILLSKTAKFWIYCINHFLYPHVYVKRSLRKGSEILILRGNSVARDFFLSCWWFLPSLGSGMGGFKTISLKPKVIKGPSGIVTSVEHEQSLERAGNRSRRIWGSLCT